MTRLDSWVVSANTPDTGFPLNNLPYGVFSDRAPPRCGVAIGDKVLDLAALQAAGLLPDCGFAEPGLNGFLRRGPAAWSDARRRLTALLAVDAPKRDAVAACLHELAEVTLHLPFTVAEFTDFYAGRHHATNVGTMFRGAENALPPNWLHMPIGYNGRASTVVVSGTPVRRPLGQTRPPDADLPGFGPTRRLDFELELGAVVGTGSAIGTPVDLDRADAMIFGYVLLNDWSARDIQAWEYQPLGPFQAKAFATTIGAWVVTAEALAPFRTAAPPREIPLLPHLRDAGPMHYDIDLSVDLAPEAGPEVTICRTNARELYYSAAQQLAHHASSGCAMRVGDLLGSGTISGPTREARGSMLELSWGGTEPIALPDGSRRSFLEDGDRVTLRGAARGDGYLIGFGDCSGTILPAPSSFSDGVSDSSSRE